MAVFEIPRLVVFDMAGTTVHDGDAVNEALRRALLGHGVTVTRAMANAVMGIAKPIAIRQLLESEQERSGVEASDANTKTVYQSFLSDMLLTYREGSGLREIAGASDLFRRLRARDIKVALDTGFSRVIADTIVARLDWQEAGLIDAMVTADEAPGRPYPDMIQYLMRKVGVNDVTQVAKVGDTPSDLQQGSAAGCRWVIGVTRGSHTAAELAPFPHTHLISTIADLRGIWEL